MILPSIQEKFSLPVSKALEDFILFDWRFFPGELLLNARGNL